MKTLVIAFLLLAPFAVFAQAGSRPDPASKCKAGYKERRVFGPAISSLRAAQEGVPNAAIAKIPLCSDHTVEVNARISANQAMCFFSGNCTVKLTITTTRPCCSAEDRKKYGCGEGQIHPTLTYKDTFTHGPDAVRSKCDSKLPGDIRASASERSARPLRRNTLDPKALEARKREASINTTRISSGERAAFASSVVKDIEAKTGKTSKTLTDLSRSSPEVFSRIGAHINAGNPEAAAKEADAAGVPKAMVEEIRRMTSADLSPETKTTLKKVQETAQRPPASTFNTTNKAPVAPPSNQDAFTSSYTGFSGPTSSGSPFGNMGFFGGLLSIGKLFLPQLLNDNNTDTTNPQRPLRRFPQAPSMPIGNDPALIAGGGIYVRPHAIDRGSPFIVTWFSNGMSRSKPCAVHVENSRVSEIFAAGYAGSKSVSGNATKKADEWEFTLKCTTAAGAPYERKTSAEVK